MAKKASTLITSPRSQADFALRLAFFALAPFAIVPLWVLFPVTGALVNVGVALVVFIASEAVRAWAARSKLVARLLARELEFEAYYRAHAPRPFLYYVFYPLLFPYWLIQREARREFWLFKGYTLTSLAILLASLGYQYFEYWPPELDVRDYAPIVALTLGVETLLVLALLMPIATTVVRFHGTMRRRRLVVLLVVGLASTSVQVVRLLRRRDPIVSYATRVRVRQRQAASPKRARDAEIAALKTAWAYVGHWRGAAVEGDGKVEGTPLDRARDVLSRFYKPDEAFAFDLWASPKKDPKLLVLYFEGSRTKPPIWVAMKRTEEEVRDVKDLPHGAFVAMKHAAEQ